MSSKREEERNEKIIRGLMKLPPNRRCINCNSLGPQYVCTNFWTFVCINCSGIHREFTHRVKSVSMAKFTSQEVDALQKGGNQRARELFLKAWDHQSQRLPDNSNVDKVREFIKNVYVQKKYALEKLPDRPPRDPQNLRSNEDESTRASSYHSYSQSPPYDFQYEERRYGKPAPALTRKPGSDRGIYGAKLSSFLSPSRFSDHTNDDRFANESSNPRVSDYSISSRGDPFKSDIFLASSQKDIEVEPSREIPLHHAVLHDSDADIRNSGGRVLHSQRSSSSGSAGSLENNSMSFKSVNSMGLPEVSFESKKSVEISHDNYPSSVSGNFNGVNLFNAPFAPQNVTSPTPTISNSQMQESSAKSSNLFQQIPNSLPILNERKPLQTPQLSTIDLFPIIPQQQSAVPFNEKTSDVVKPNDEDWATFDMPQNVVPVDTGNYAASAVLPPSDGILLENLKPISLAQNPSAQGLVSHETSVLEPVVWKEGMNIVEGAPNNAHLWNAFEDSAKPMQLQNTPKTSEHSSELHALYIDECMGSSVYEVLNNNGIRASYGNEPPSSGLSSHFNMALHDFSMAPAMAGVHPLATDHKPSNPFDLPYDSETESGSLFWDMSSVQAALPSNQMPTSFVGGTNQSWFPQISGVSYVPGGVTFDSHSGSLGFMAAQTPSTQMPNIPSHGPVASVGGNPFA